MSETNKAVIINNTTNDEEINNHTGIYEENAQNVLNNDGLITIAFGERRESAQWVNQTGKWSDFLTGLSQTKRTGETIAEYKEWSKRSQDKSVAKEVRRQFAMKKDRAKDVGGFVGGELRVTNSNRRKSNIKNRHLLTLDADFAKDGFWDTVEMVFEYACAMYSTHSHTPEKPKLRLVIPMTRPVTPDEYEAISRKVSSWLDIDVFDPSTHQANRLMYLPSTAIDGEFLFEYQDEEWLNPDEVLATYDNWADINEWSFSVHESKEAKRSASKAGDPFEKKGVVGAFNRVYNVHAAIEIFLSDVYESGSAPDRYTLIAASSENGLAVYNDFGDGSFVYSNHSTDPAFNKLVNAFDLVRLHKFGHLDVDVKEGTKINNTPSYKAMAKLAKEDEAVLNQLVESQISHIGTSGGSGGSNDGGGNGSNGGGEDSSPNGLHLPDNVRIPDYLRAYLEGVVVPDEVNMSFLLKIGEDALIAKAREVVEQNEKSSGAKKRIPEKLGFDEVAIIMMSLYRFRNIQMTDRSDDTILALYDEDDTSLRKGTYTTSTKQLFSIMERIAPDFKERDMLDVIAKIERAVPTSEQTRDKNLFAVNNGIYDKESRQLLPFSPDYVYLTKIPVSYRENPVNPVITAPDGYKWDVDSWITDVASNDTEVTTLIWQVIADCLQPTRSRHKSIWFYSEKGNNGKGTIGQLIKNVLGKGNFASLSVVDFNHEFMKETLVGVAANIADENDVNMYIDSVKDYKASVTGDDINVNRKYEKPLRIQFFGTNIQMMNGLPKTKDKSESFYRRLLIVPFMKSFTNNGERKYIKETYIYRQDVLEYVLFKALNIDFDEYITPLASAQLISSYKEKNNPVLEYWNEVKEEFVWDLLPTQFLYDMYGKWSEMNNPNGKMMSKRSFTDDLVSVIQMQGDPWEFRGSNQVRSAGKMDADEPLITTYGLDDYNKFGGASNKKWVNMNSSSTNLQTRRNFTRQAKYYGFVRI